MKEYERTIFPSRMLAKPSFLKKYNLRRIRFHDLRHSCASLLLANGVSLKEIQAWLGYSHYSTTANILFILSTAQSFLQLK
ncbi:tyrosine-type recombinase/integrase [Paenibacillus sp. FSL K6-1230]